MNTQEIYANITGFPKYQISTFGNIKNVRTGRILKPGIDGAGYYKVTLRNNGYSSNKNIHKLVASEFLENPDSKNCVDHIDRDKTNNHILNLRWATIIENGQNRSIGSNNKSGVIGVDFHKKNQKWRAQIKADGRRIYLGSFEDKNDAIVARENAEMRYFGSFRSTNI